MCVCVCVMYVCVCVHAACACSVCDHALCPLGIVNFYVLVLHNDVFFMNLMK